MYSNWALRSGWDAPLLGFAVGLQAVLQILLEQTGYRSFPDAVSFPAQFHGQMAGALASPAQRGHRVPASRGSYQPLQFPQNRGLLLLDPLSSSSDLARPLGRNLTPLKLP
jgi:hypothetical protein